MGRPTTPLNSPRRAEHTTPQKVRFFTFYDTEKCTIAEAAREAGVLRSTASRWIKKRQDLGDAAIRRTRPLSTTLGRPSNVDTAHLHALLEPDHPSHYLKYDVMAEKENIPLTGRSLRRQFARIGARKFRTPTVKPISSTNKTKRRQYCGARCRKTVTDYWKFVYFTDEAHFRTRDLSARDEYDLRKPNGQRRLERLQELKPSIDITVHVAAGISYNQKGVFLFYNDPNEPGPKQYTYKPRRPRKSSVQTQEEYEQDVREWEASQPPQVDIKPKGNSMTQKFYTENVLPHHIKHIHELEARYKHTIYFQEDNDGSHGTRSAVNIARQLKEAAHITSIPHPPQSPDLNPIEPIWRIIKQRLRGGEWTSVQGFKDDIEAQWKHISQSSIRKRITDMKWRCEQCEKLDGRRIRSKLW